MRTEDARKMFYEEVERAWTLFPDWHRYGAGGPGRVRRSSRARITVEFRDLPRLLWGQAYEAQCLVLLDTDYVQLNPEAEVLDTIRHEIAHVIVGPRGGHGSVWKRVARELGATPLALNSEVVWRGRRYRAWCTDCEEWTGYDRSRRSKAMSDHRFVCLDNREDHNVCWVDTRDGSMACGDCPQVTEQAPELMGVS